MSIMPRQRLCGECGEFHPVVCEKKRVSSPLLGRGGERAQPAAGKVPESESSPARTPAVPVKGGREAMKPSEMTTMELLEAVGRRLSLYQHTQTREEGEALLERAGRLKKELAAVEEDTPACCDELLTSLNEPSALLEGEPSAAEAGQGPNDSPPPPPSTIQGPKCGTCGGTGEVQDPCDRPHCSKDHRGKMAPCPACRTPRGEGG